MASATQAQPPALGTALSSPLGVAAARPRGRLPRPGAGGIVLGALGLAVIGVALYLSLARDPLGGEPVVVARIEIVPPPPSAAPQAPGAAIASAEPAAPGNRLDAAELEAETGIKVIRRGGAAPGSILLRVPDEPGAVRLAPAPDARLVETSRQGPLPRVGTDGARPADVYARPVLGTKPGRPRVALLVGGLGIGREITREAVAKLPGAVSLAFAPYGAAVEQEVAEARAAGHEVMLQAPMEPFDYPDNDPGPQTLLAAATPEQNLHRLHWLLSRFPGYVGVMNYMGAKFTASPEALRPVMRDIAARGLLFLDDASSMRSVATDTALRQGGQAARADIVLDAVPRASDIDAQLAKLEALARDKGTAIGVASALPASLAEISRWAGGLSARGIDLVPVSAAVPRPKPAG